MISKPILFSGPMVRAILEGRKTQTRRIVKIKGLEFVGGGGEGSPDWNDPACWGFEDTNQGLNYALVGSDDAFELPRPHPVGSEIWVREAFGWTAKIPCSAHRQAVKDGFAPRDWYTYKADNEPGHWCGFPSIHMPRWLSRLTLKVTDVRVQRLQDISRDDAASEGLSWVMPTYGIPGAAGSWDADPRISYRWLWESINGPGSWAANPWVWAYTFERVS